MIIWGGEAPHLTMTNILKKRYQVFVSSTYQDLAEERKHVIQALLETKCIPAGMELFPAASEDQWSLIKHVIDDSDYYIVVVAGKYGSCGPGGRSFTEMEFDYAIQAGKPVMGFFHENVSHLPGAKLEMNARTRKKLEAFTAKVKSRICRAWNTPDSLASAVKSAMLNAIERDPQPGWIKANEAPDPELVGRLKERITELEARAAKQKSGSHLHSDKSIELPINIKYATCKDDRNSWTWHDKAERFNTTFNEIFCLLAPRLIEKKSRIGLKKILNYWVTAQLAEKALELAPEASIKFPPVADVDRESFEQILHTFVAEKLVKRVSPPAHVRTKDMYWLITSAGAQRLSEFQAMPLEEDPHKNDSSL